MKRLSLIFLTAAVALLAAGCDMRPEIEIAPEEGCYEFTLQASSDCEPATRTSYAGDKSFSWTAGDKISVIFHNGATDRFFTLTAQNAGASSTFKGSITNGYTIGAADGSNCALYPASDKHKYENGTFYYYRPGEIEMSPDGFSSNIPLSAIEFSNNSLIFRPMCTVVKFSFSGLTASRVNLSVKNLDSHTLSGYFDCRVSSSVYLVWKQLSDNNADSPARSISFTETVEDGKAAFYVNCPPWGGSYFKPQLSLTDASTGAVLYSATAKQALPSSTNASLGNMVVIPEINLGEVPPAQAETVYYTESDAIFANPERGFYKAEEYRKASQSVLSNNRLNSIRTSGRSLMLLEYYLTDFISSDISSSYLTLIENNFKALRKGGVKCILRFAYSDNHEESSHPWDATEAWVMRHIEQLSPLFTNYSDVIFVLQAGFIGSWGEWYYSDNFGMHPNEDFAARGRVLDALLNALPADRQVGVRTPTFKMKLVGNTALSSSTAHKGTPQARVGGHNDCFGADSNDTGTYRDDSERSFWAADTRYTIMGGETCKLSDFCHCGAYGGNPGTLSELAKYHWSYLHDGYHQGVLDRWSEEGCFDKIEKELGYRLVLEDATFGPATAGGSMDVSIRLHNTGYAAPMNPRTAYLVLTDASSGKVLQSYALDNTDPRFWGPDDGQITIEKTIAMPDFHGNVKLHLYLPDPDSRIESDPRFAIRFANEGIWDSNTGYNLLYSFGL